MTYSVKDIARLLGLTPSAIHYFEKERLIEPEKDEHGRRYYKSQEVFRFLSYAKYRSMGFPMKTIINQFNGEPDSLELICARLDTQKNEARRKAEYYKELERSIDAHIASARQIGSLLNKYEFSKSPRILAMHDEECGWASKNAKSQLSAQKWVKAMPMARLIVMLNSLEEDMACFGYSIDTEKGRELGLPTDLHTEELESVSCLHTVVMADECLASSPYSVFKKPLEYAHSRGLEVCGKPWGYIILVEVAPDKTQKAYVELWIPVE